MVADVRRSSGTLIVSTVVVEGRRFFAFAAIKTARRMNRGTDAGSESVSSFSGVPIVMRVLFPLGLLTNVILSRWGEVENSFSYTREMGDVRVVIRLERAYIAAVMKDSPFR